MKRTEARWLLALVALGLVAGIVGLMVWLRAREAPMDGPAAPASAASTRGARRLRARDAPPPKLGSIAGRVADAAGSPVAGALACASASAGASLLTPVDLGEPTCVPAGEDGRYQISGLSPMRLTIFASAPGHRPAVFASPDPDRARWIDLRQGEARTGVDLTLVRGGVEVRGQVKDVSGGPVAGALVTVHGFPGSHQGTAVTRSDAEGAFSAWTEEGHCLVRATADGYAEGSQHSVAPGPPIEILLTPGSVLEGRVVEAGSGAPIAGAKISPGMEQRWGPGEVRPVSSDAEGRFRVTGLAPGRYKPTARAAGGYGQARASVVLGVGQTSSEVVIEMHPASSVAGRVEVAPGGGPCTSGAVTLVHEGSGWLSAVLEADGSARFEGLLPGSYQVMVFCQDHASEPTYPAVEVGEADLEGLVWTVRAGLSLRGRVVDREGVPVRAAVQAMPVDRGGMPSGAFGQSEDNGRFVLRGLLPGKHRVMARSDDHVPPEPVEVDLVDERAPEVTLVMDSGGSIQGTVTDEDRRPIAGAEVTAMSQQPGWGGPPSRSLADGTFVIKGITPGEYRVWATQAGMPMRRPGQAAGDAPGVAVTVKAGSTARVSLVVERQDGEIRGRVVDESGGPVADAFVDVHREPDGADAPGAPPRPPMPPGEAWSNSPVLADTDGAFVVGNLSRGTYTVQAHRRGGGSGVAEHVKVGDTVTLTIQATGTVSGTVSTAGGAPPDRFTIRVTGREAPFFRHESFAFTDGAWTMSDLPAGQYDVAADAADGTATAEVTLAQGEQRSGVALTLAGRVAIKGQVVSLEDGAPMAGVTVRAYPRAGGMAPSRMPDHKVTDKTGHFHVDRVPSGPLLVMLMPADPMSSAVDPATVPVEVQPGEVTDVGRLFMARRRLKQGEFPGDLGFTLEPTQSPMDVATRPHRVVEVRRGGPAAAAGLQVGDEIVSVDGHDVTGKLGYLVGTLLMVSEGTRVTLGLSRGASASILAAAMSPPPGAGPAGLGPAPRPAPASP
ncbi:carboxypeptidase regulatory-like domain-containing protein [Sorangium sp. So ce1335]|uniref:carboxypeptidase regulatory-like domain-containing protein n=1 Tax=Sorangium sp. So ce1335 TaxID=3133335 RepID=UPI003F648E2D